MRDRRWDERVALTTLGYVNLEEGINLWNSYDLDLDALSFHPDRLVQQRKMLVDQDVRDPKQGLLIPRKGMLVGAPRQLSVQLVEGLVNNLFAEFLVSGADSAAYVVKFCPSSAEVPWRIVRSFYEDVATSILTCGNRVLTLHQFSCYGNGHSTAIWMPPLEDRPSMFKGLGASTSAIEVLDTQSMIASRVTAATLDYFAGNDQKILPRLNKRSVQELVVSTLVIHSYSVWRARGEVIRDDFAVAVQEALGSIRLLGQHEVFNHGAPSWKNVPVPGTSLRVMSPKVNELGATDSSRDVGGLGVRVTPGFCLDAPGALEFFVEELGTRRGTPQGFGSMEKRRALECLATPCPRASWSSFSKDAYEVASPYFGAAVDENATAPSVFHQASKVAADFDITSKPVWEMGTYRVPTKDVVPIFDHLNRSKKC